MKLQTLFDTCSRILKKSGDSRIKTEEGMTTYRELSKELDNLGSWCYKGEIDVQKIIRCKNCRHYKRYKKKNVKNPYEHTTFCACSLDKLKRKPEFYCSNGEEM